MHMVRHQRPRTNAIEAPLAISDENGVGDHIGNPGVAKPSWPGRPTVQEAIIGNEGVAGSGVFSNAESGW